MMVLSRINPFHVTWYVDVLYFDCLGLAHVQKPSAERGGRQEMLSRNSKVPTACMNLNPRIGIANQGRDQGDFDDVVGARAP